MKVSAQKKVVSRPSLKFERRVGYPEVLVAGTDEVGRGCLAGPVVAGAVIVPNKISYKKDPWLRDVDDSKQLSASDRERLAPLIFAWASAAAIGVASVAEIDQINIFQASFLAIQRSVENLSIQPQHILIDGKFVPSRGLWAPTTAIIKGDHLSLSIAAASIIAKVWRDRYMVELDRTHPGYGFEKHKGYPTPFHKQAVVRIGRSEVHRKSFFKKEIQVEQLLLLKEG